MLREVQSTSATFGVVKEELKEGDAITGTLVRVAHYGEEDEKRNDAFSALEKRYHDTLPLVNPASPSREELELLRSELIDAKKKIDEGISKAETSLMKAEKDVKVLQEKEIKLSQYEMIAFTAGMAILGNLFILLFFKGR